ncbi:MAG TPA: hypothetical protein DCE55_27410 [Planctomycetaceae bacterium]|nr:hypothetical protein [Planctomycetaceae bacterium]|tara:strand:+ start:1871 stop:5545 length:3675 start_codon:yes stop_codon:yes gene_type:complete
MRSTIFRPVTDALFCLALTGFTATASYGQQRAPEKTADEQVQSSFRKEIQPLLKTLCLRCHNAEKMESGIRLDHLDGTLPDKNLFHWRDVRKQLLGMGMPPEGERQPTDAERDLLVGWIQNAMIVARQRNNERNGLIRRLTVAQYQNTIRELLQLEEDLTAVLPADGISAEGFANNVQTLALSPLLIEAYFNIAEQALDLSIVDPETPPVIQTFQMDLGKDINPTPIADKLILGAGSLLIDKPDVVVRELAPEKPFAYTPFSMRKDFQFIEGYQGNDTVRGLREFHSIYHAVFACMRGTNGYPRGAAYETVPGGLLLRPAIPSSEIFGQESTYGPRANFKVSLRELPAQGNFRITVRAARMDDGLLLDSDTAAVDRQKPGGLRIDDPGTTQEVMVPEEGIYQVDAYAGANGPPLDAPDASRLTEELVGIWSLDGTTARVPVGTSHKGKLVGAAKFVESPFGQAITVDGKSGAVVIPRDPQLKVGDGAFTVAAWIHPRELRQGGIVCLGGYGYVHGWILDMPNAQGVLRLETARPGKIHNGTVQSRPGVLRANQWQHVAVVVERDEKTTRLYVNGYEVGSGTIAKWDLDNPDVQLHIGRVQNAQFFSGDIDDVRIYRRALGKAELQALVEPGRRFAFVPAAEKPQNLTLQLGERYFSGILTQPAFLAVRLPAGAVTLRAQYAGDRAPSHIQLTRVDPGGKLARTFAQFEKRRPTLGVHVGLRRDCGSTLNPVGKPRPIASTELKDFVFQDAVNNYPSPDVERGNMNYLAGFREIGVRSEYSDGRPRPRLRVQSIRFEGPYYESWPPASHRNLFPETAHVDGSPEYAAMVIRKFAERAFRRPLDPEELASLMSLWRTTYEQVGDFRGSIRDVFLVVLTSPQFLFLIENSQTPEAEHLTSYELASKLSYFLWNGPPDARLLQLAAADTLRESLDAEVLRLIASPKFDRCVETFTAQWLSLDKFEVLEVDRSRYPSLTRDTRIQLRQEPITFVKYLVQQNLPLRNLLHSDFIMANEVVASYYGLGDRTESGLAFVPLRHQQPHLGGLLSQASILAGLSDGRNSNPIKRGAWLARKIVAEPPDDPPPNVPQLDENPAEKLTLREKLERHRNQKGCANCHAGIDPWGLPFQEYDAGGLYRQMAGAETQSTLPDTTEVGNVADLKKYLLEERIDRVAFSFLKHLAIYATGRSLTYNELVYLEEHGIQLRADGYLLQDLVRFVVQSDLFLKK